VTIRDWIVKRLGGEDPVRVERVVELGRVELWRSELVVAALREAGVPAEAAPTSGPPGGSDSIFPMVSIYVPGDRLADARQVFDTVIRADS
jgi:hypothetical protein